MCVKSKFFENYIYVFRMNFSFEKHIEFTNETSIDSEIGGIVYFLSFLSEYLPYTLFNCLAAFFGIFGSYFSKFKCLYLKTCFYVSTPLTSEVYAWKNILLICEHIKFY